MGCEQKVRIADLESFVKSRLLRRNNEEDARITAEVLAETDAFGTHSTVPNLHGYIKKFQREVWT